MSNYVVSISREFGSGGRLIGKKLAASLGIPCYDRTLIQKTAEKSGLSPDFIARAEERARSRFHLNIAPIGIGVPTFTHQGIPVSHQAFFAQADVIRELAAEGPCVIVGRCSDYILGKTPLASKSLSMPTWPAGSTAVWRSITSPPTTWRAGSSRWTGAAPTTITITPATPGGRCAGMT